jgi:hypothetical protein
MFEDLDEEGADVTPDSPDRALAWAIWSRGEVGSVTPEEAWAILHERYPDDPRFLLLNSYAELSETQKRANGPKAAAGVFTAGYFLKSLERLLGSSTEALHPQLRDLVLFGGAVLGGAQGDEAKTLAALRTKIGAEVDGEPKRDERDRAGLRLRRFEREVVKELHDRTAGGKPLGVRAAVPAAASPANDWAAAVADGNKPRRKYVASERFERGELIEHPKFGVGLVTGTEPGKTVILFESGVRKLVAGA